MPRAHGTDRLEPAPAGRVGLACSQPKAWVSRRPAAAQAPVHPGTAVRWEDELWEVVAAEARPDGGVRYELAPWDDQHAIRVLLPYDETSEAERAADVRHVRRRRVSAWAAFALAPVVGLLPGRVQESLALELGIRASRLTLASILAPAAVGFHALVTTMVAGFAPGLQAAGPSVGPLLPLVAYFFPEALVRFIVVMAQDRPVGSLLGVPLYLAGRVTGLVPPPDGTPASAGPTPESRVEGDRYLMIEPLLALLPALDQLLLRERYGFSPATWGKRTAWFLLVYPGFTAPAQAARLALRGGGLPEVLLLAATLLVAAEQVRRLRLLSLGQPAPSLLGRLVRPLARPLLCAAPGAPAPGPRPAAG